MRIGVMKAYDRFYLKINTFSKLMVTQHTNYHEKVGYALRRVCNLCQVPREILHCEVVTGVLYVLSILCNLIITRPPLYRESFFPRSKARPKDQGCGGWGPGGENFYF